MYEVWDRCLNDWPGDQLPQSAYCGALGILRIMIERTKLTNVRCKKYCCVVLQGQHSNTSYCAQFLCSVVGYIAHGLDGIEFLSPKITRAYSSLHVLHDHWSASAVHEDTVCDCDLVSDGQMGSPGRQIEVGLRTRISSRGRSFRIPR